MDTQPKLFILEIKKVGKKMSYAEKINLVINRIEKLNMPTTIDNINNLIGIYQMLLAVRDELASQPEISVDVEEVSDDAGKVDAK